MLTQERRGNMSADCWCFLSVHLTLDTGHCHQYLCPLMAPRDVHPDRTEEIAVFYEE